MQLQVTNIKGDFNLSLWFIIRQVTFRFQRAILRFCWCRFEWCCKVTCESCHKTQVLKIRQSQYLITSIPLFQKTNIRHHIEVLPYSMNLCILLPPRRKSLAQRCPPLLPIGPQLEADSCRIQARHQCRHQRCGCFLQAPPIRQKLTTADTCCSKAQYHPILNSHVICIVIFLVVPFCVDVRYLARANKSNEVKSFSRSRYGYGYR